MGAVAGVVPSQVMMSAARNGDFRQDFTFSTVTGPFDLTNFSATMMLKTAPGASQALLSLNSGTPTTNGSLISFTDPVNGVMEVYISQLDLQALPTAPGGAPSEFAYDLVMTEPGADSGPWLYGVIIVSQGVTF